MLKFFRMPSMTYTTHFERQTLTTSRGKTFTECEKPRIGLVICYRTSLTSQGHDIPRGYVVTQVYTKKGSDPELVNKAEIMYIVSAKDGTVEYQDDANSRRIIFLTQGGRWLMRDGDGSDPYIEFGSLKVPWTQQEMNNFLQYSLGN